MSMTTYESVKKGLAFIEANLQNNIGVWDVANAVSYSQFYFSREFSRYTHISIYDYIIKRKMSESYKYLFKNEIKIVDLAFRYGFQSHEVYTRAFKKIFKENPSEAVVYKPLALFEPIDDHYLEFLKDLKVETFNTTTEECYFEANSVTELTNGHSFLVLLSKENLFSCKWIFEGQLGYGKNRFLSFQLNGLKHKIRIYHNDVKMAFRYFIDNSCDMDEISSNFIIVNSEKHHIDIYIPYNV
jgi:AraC-like DNA-binding protein